MAVANAELKARQVKVNTPVEATEAETGSQARGLVQKLDMLHRTVMDDLEHPWLFCRLDTFYAAHIKARPFITLDIWTSSATQLWLLRHSIISCFVKKENDSQQEELTNMRRGLRRFLQ